MSQKIMQLKECINLLGRAINDRVVTEFIEKYGYKYPKKDKISIQNQSTSFWIEHNKLGINILLDIDWANSNYKGVPTKKRSVYHPRVVQISFKDSNHVESFPFYLTFLDSYSEVVTKIGRQTSRSSDISYIWLNDGKETFYDWEISIDKSKNIDLAVRCYDKVNSIALKLHENEELIKFYDELMYETFESYIQEFDNKDLAYAMFIRWLNENGYIENPEEDIFEYIKSLNKGYFGMDDIIKDNFLIRRYIHNLDGNNIYLYNDFEKEFLSNTNLDNKLLEQIMVILESKESKISNTEENYHRMKKVWDGLFL